MTDPMASLDAAYAAVKRAEDQAAELINAARLEFGREIRRMRERGTQQTEIADHFGWKREHVRRLQEAADIADGLKPPRTTNAGAHLRPASS
ncbi:hypothetical protein ACFYOK_37495 [Microbispora bryophytorum]|uniref:hypothetical protein n=1 Tax=Microbispora bryophytorum TaxID=1460882 RepID=UPI0033D01622